MPLIRQYWLARKSNRRVALQPVLDRENNRVDFKVVEDSEVSGDPSQATTSGGDTRCLLCEQVVKSDTVREWGRTNGFGDILTAVVTKTPNKTGKNYRSANKQDLNNILAVKSTLNSIVHTNEGELAPIPDEPINPKTLGLRIDAIGFYTWGQLFNQRQAVALHTFSKTREISFRRNDQSRYRLRLRTGSFPLYVSGSRSSSCQKHQSVHLPSWT